MQTKIKFVLFLFLGVALHLSAQHHVVFKVVEQGSKLPMIGVYIGISSQKDKPITQKQYTNEKGIATFDITANKTFYYKVHTIGYLPLSGIVKPTENEIELVLQEDVMHLNDVVVTGSVASRPVKLSAVTTQVLGGKALVEAGYGDLQHALQQETPGLNFQKVGFGNDISMQGLDARHVLFLQDGERMTGEMAGNLDYERFNLHAIDRIEIVKGASSTLYGSRASGAVINMISKKTNKPLSVLAGVRWSQMNERNYKHPSPKDFLYMFEKNSDRPNVQAWISAGAKKGAFTSQTDILYSSSDAFYMYQSDRDKKVYTKQANPFLPSDITLTGIAKRPPMGIEGSEHVSVAQKLYYEPNDNLSLQLYGSTFFMNSYDLIEDMTFTQSRDFMTGLKFKYSLHDWFDVHLSLHGDFYDRFKRRERIDFRKKVYKSSIFEPRLSITSHYFAGHSLIFGIEHTSDVLTSDRFVNARVTTRSLHETEYFLQDEWSANSHWLLSAGIRTNFSRSFGFMWMPKLAVKYSLNNHLAFRTNLSKGYRAPSIKELFFNWDHLGMFSIKGNEQIRPETNYYVSLGTEYSSDNFFFNVNLYGNYFRKKIEGVWKIYDMQYNFEYTNLNNQRILGVEALLKWNFLSHFTLNATYSYVNMSKLNGIQVNSSSPHAATASLDYNYVRPKYRLKAIFNASFMGKKEFDVQDRIKLKTKSYNAYFRTSLPPYVLCNLALVQTFYDKAKVTLGVNNLFNYIPRTLGSGITLFNIPATPGARAYVQVEFLLDNIINSLKRKK